ncbi:MAG: metal-dependent hydrolase [Acidimicrobiales bacterium]
MPQTRNADRKIPTRRISFDESFKDVPKHFAADGDVLLSHLAVALSAVFPDGEDFFVRSVRRFRDRIADPALKHQVAGFIGQEAVHGREHRDFNARMAQHGYPTKQVEAITRKGLAIRERLMSPKSNLAVTAALEHFTATLAELVMTNEEVRNEFGNNAVRNLFLWHALEESEHKAVAFDVYKAVGGSERTRVMTMNFLRFGFVVGMAVQIFVSMLLDRATYRPVRLWRSLRTFRRSPLVSKQLWLQLKDYNRPDFHPDDRDTSALIEKWRTELFGENGTLNELLAGSAA